MTYLWLAGEGMNDRPPSVFLGSSCSRRVHIWPFEQHKRLMVVAKERQCGGGAERDRGRLHKLEARKPYCLLVERQRARTPCPHSKLRDQRVRE